MRYAILAAVSTAPQAQENKGSLKDQEATARAFGRTHNGQETGVYILDGYSRTGYEGLAEAAADIPPLAQMLSDLDAGVFDVLIVDNFDRLGDLAQMVAVRFRKRGKQLVSARQSGRIVEPEKYDPYSDDVTAISMAVESIIQNYRINKLRRGYNVGLPERVENGLHPVTVPFGYSIVGKNEPAAIVPEEAAMMKIIKDWFLDGIAQAEINRRAQRKFPEHNFRQTGRMLRNPYYAGFVRFGATHYGEFKPRSEWMLRRGSHEPLWDEDTHHAILVEIKRRQENRRGSSRFALTGLVICGECKRKLRYHSQWSTAEPKGVFVCPTSAEHFILSHDESAAYLGSAIVRKLSEYVATPPQDIDVSELERELGETLTLRERVQTGYEAGLYTLEESLKKLSTIDEQAASIQHQIDTAEDASRQQREFTEYLSEAQEGFSYLPELIRDGDTDEQGEINKMLSKLIRKVIVQSNLSLEITLMI